MIYIEPFGSKAGKWWPCGREKERKKPTYWFCVCCCCCSLSLQSCRFRSSYKFRFSFKFIRKLFGRRVELERSLRLRLSLKPKPLELHHRRLKELEVCGCDETSSQAASSHNNNNKWLAALLTAFTQPIIQAQKYSRLVCYDQQRIE